jgi:hypothetical protein
VYRKEGDDIDEKGGKREERGEEEELQVTNRK